MRHLFLIDPPPRLAPRADTSIAFMREAAARGHEVWETQIEDFGARDGGTAVHDRRHRDRAARRRRLVPPR
jgi:hypothetical protein